MIVLSAITRGIHYKQGNVKYNWGILTSKRGITTSITDITTIPRRISPIMAKV